MHSPALKFFIWGLVAAFALAAVIWADRRTYARWQREQEQVANGDASLRQPAHVEWQPVNLQDLTLQPSSFTCTTADPAHQTCMFKDVAFYRGDLIYITASKQAASSVKLPDPLVFEVGNSPTNDFSIPEILSVRSASDVRADIKRQAGPKLAVAQYDMAIFQRTRTFNNWFWALNGAGNIFHRLCKYFDLCTPAAVKSAAVLQPIIQSSRNLSEVGYLGLPKHHANAVHDLMSCFGPLFWVNHPSGREVDSRPEDQLIIFRQLLVGIGADVVQPKAALSEKGEVRYKQAAADISLKRVQFIRQCAGLAPTPTPRTRPSVLLVNRPWADGRSILSLDDVSDRLRRALPPDVNVRIFLPRGDAGIADQASAFDAATVVVAPHGAATANFNFLPHDAVALGVFALKGRFGHDEAVGASMPAPPYNLTVLPIDCTERTEARALAASQTPEFAALAPGDQISLLLGHEMTPKWGHYVRDLTGFSLLDWMDFRAYSPDPAELTQAVLDAVRLWEAKVAARSRPGG